MALAFLQPSTDISANVPILFVGSIVVKEILVLSIQLHAWFQQVHKKEVWVLPIVTFNYYFPVF